MRDFVTCTEPPISRSVIDRDSQTKALIAARAALEKQAEDVVVMDLRGLSVVTDFFVICTAGSTRQLDAVKDHIEATLLQHGGRVWHTEGLTSSRDALSTFERQPHWVLMDCGEIVVHLLDQYARSFYRLEDLWADATRLPLPVDSVRIASESSDPKGSR